MLQLLRVHGLQCCHRGIDTCEVRSRSDEHEVQLGHDQLKRGSGLDDGLNGLPNLRILWHGERVAELGAPRVIHQAIHRRRRHVGDRVLKHSKKRVQTSS